ncbi:hypothetical protein, partial [Nodosilinea sp. LEGE 07298]|uniref:hypothetical protein n=1 Tax=Nodosilinea sp. LEGE 07298 TaxID=2777970 RepID=UPI001D1422B7
VCNGKTNRFIACGSTLPSLLGHHVGLLSALPLFYSTQTWVELDLVFTIRINHISELKNLIPQKKDGETTSSLAAVQQISSIVLSTLSS